MTVTVFGYLILISIDFDDFFLRFLLRFSPGLGGGGVLDPCLGIGVPPRV